VTFIGGIVSTIHRARTYIVASIVLTYDAVVVVVVVVAVAAVAVAAAAAAAAVSPLR